MRLSAAAGVLAYAVFGQLHLDRLGGTPFWVSFCAHVSFNIMLFANYFLFIVTAAPPPGLGTVKKLLWTLYSLVFNPRGIGMPWQIKAIPPFDRKDPNYVPTRFAFVARRIFTSILFFAMLKIFAVASQDIFDSNLQDGDYSEKKESIFRRMGDVSMRELLIRAWLPVDYFFGSVCIITYQHSLVSAIAVTLGDEPQMWPPMLGDIRDAYSLRRFWGSYWHGMLRSALVSNAVLIAEIALRVSRRFPMYRQLVTILVFALSGAGHAIGYWAPSPICEATSTLRWNLLMGLAVAFEDLVRWVFSGMAAGRWWRAFGYVWVWMYLAWSLPKMLFPNAACI